jgi:putative ABC transport system permease protein
VKLFRWLLLAYPPDFRRRYEQGLLLVFEQLQRDPSYVGPLGRLRFWTFILTDCFLVSARLWRRRLYSRSHPSLPPQQSRTEMDTIVQDVSYALRQLVRRPGFAAVSILSLGLAIGANSLIYGLVEGLVLRPFPYPDPDRLVAVGVGFPRVSNETGYVEVLSPAEYADIRKVSAFATAAAFDLGNRNISGGDVPERVFTALLLDDLFPVVGMPPQLGRGFTREELAPGGPAVAIISNRLWHSRFGGDPRIVGRSVRIGNQSATVVGVMPPGLLLIGTDLWLPWGGDQAKMPRNVRQFTVLARLRNGMSLSTANAELATVAARIDQTHRSAFKEYQDWSLTATPWAAALLRDLRPAAFLLLGAVALVLLIACANLANLFLARSTTNQRELAVRLALGAARSRIARLVLTESLLVSGLGAAAGILLATFGIRAASALLPAQMQLLDLHATFNLHVFFWSLALAAGTGILAGVVPALHATRTDPHESLKADGRSGAGRPGSRLRSVLVVAEVALSVTLLLGAGLFMRTFNNIQRVDPGFEPRGVLTMRLTLPRERYPGESGNLFFDSLLERLSALPQVRSAAASSQFPPMATFETQFSVERQASQNEAGIPTALITVATPGFFETLRVPMRSGRGFSSADSLTSSRVAVVNEAFVARYLGGGEAIGQRIAMGSRDRPGPWTTIVGVVANHHNGGATRPIRPEIVTPVRQQTDWNQLFVMVRTDGDAAALLPEARAAVRALDPEQPIYNVRTLEAAVAESSFQQRTGALLLSIFAAVALALAAVGIFGVLSYSVSARTQEIGVRMAVGAEPRHVCWLVGRQVLVLTGTGLAVGTGILLAGGQALSGLLFGVEPTDPVTLLSVGGLLGTVALAAAWLPALRAIRVDPIKALRMD